MSDFSDATALIRSGAVVVSDSSEVVWVTGPDAVGFLDGLLSQSIAAIPVGGTARSLLLAPNGKLRAPLLVLRGENRVGLLCDRGRGAIVSEDLRRFKIRVDVVIEPESRPVYEVWGVAAAAAVPGLPEPGRWREDGESIRFHHPFRHSDVSRVVVIGARPDVVSVPAEAVAPFRIEVGEPVMGVDLTDKTIPQEGVDVATSVDFTKGCYLGQELVARIDSRGHVNRRLAGLTVAAGPLPDRGAELLFDGKAVGEVTSAAWAVTRGEVVALAMVRREIAAGTPVTVAGREARVNSLPMGS